MAIAARLAVMATVPHIAIKMPPSEDIERGMARWLRPPLRIILVFVGCCP
jgi:hypothetical protein